MDTDFRYTKTLIVEDDPVVANLIKMILRAFRVENILISNSYNEALQLINHKQLDCIFVDYMMEPVGGIKLIEEIRKSDKTDIASTPIILCTLYTEVEHIIEARDAGVSEILAKPITSKALFYKMASAVFKRRPFISSPSFIGPDRRRRNLPLAGKPERRKKPTE